VHHQHGALFEFLVHHQHGALFEFLVHHQHGALFEFLVHHQHGALLEFLSTMLMVHFSFNGALLKVHHVAFSPTC